jgi:hypothetical protein
MDECNHIALVIPEGQNNKMAVRPSLPNPYCDILVPVSESGYGIRSGPWQS